MREVYFLDFPFFVFYSLLKESIQNNSDVSEKFNDFLKENHHLCLEEKWSHIAHLLSVTEDKKTHLNLLETLESKEVIEKLGMAMLFIKNIQNHVSNQKNTKPIFDEKTEPSTKPSLKN